MLKLIFISSCLFLLAFIMSCKPDINESDTRKEVSSKEKEEIAFSSAEKLVAYVSSLDNGYYKEKEIDEIKFSALLKPIDFIKANEKLKASSARISDSDDLQYFDFRISVNDFNMEFLKYDLANASDYPQRVNYCSFGMQNDIYLVDGNDTLPCVFYHFERAYNVVPFGHFVLAFEPTDKDIVKTKTLVYYDRLFNKGIIKLTFLPRDLIKVPKLVNA